MRAPRTSIASCLDSMQVRAVSACNREIEMLWLTLEFILFVGSSGILFNEQFRRNPFAIGVAGCVGLISFYFLMQTVTEKLDAITSSHLTPAVEPRPLSTKSSEPTSVSAPTADEIFWLSIKDTAVVALYEEFIKKFPTSPFASEARRRMESWKNADGPSVKAGGSRVEADPASSQVKPKGPFCVHVNGMQICE
jgi:hypothetical protein